MIPVRSSHPAVWVLLIVVLAALAFGLALLAPHLDDLIGP